MWHNGVERIRARRQLVGVGNDPSSLTEIIADEHCLDKGPAHPDILLTAMAQIGIESLSTCCTKKHSTQNEEPFRTGSQQTDGIPGIESLENHPTVTHMCQSQYAKHREPQ